MKKAYPFLMALTLGLLVGCDSLSGGPDLSGTWTGTYANSSGRFQSTVTLTQSGKAISGQLTAPDIFEPAITVQSDISGTLLNGTLKITVSDANAVLLTGKATASSINASGLFDLEPAVLTLERQ